MKKSQVIFDENALRKVLTENLVQEQTNRLIDYAERNIRLIGDAIQLYHSRHNMDRTGNLLNSLCWGVAYSGRLQASGFYRDARIKSYKTHKDQSTTQSFLHEFSDDKDVYEVDGRYLAEGFIKRNGRASAPNWWRVWFAILAPYWGYWEKGFRMKSKFLQFSVMSQFYDKATNDLKPAKVKIDVFVPEYSPTIKEYDWSMDSLGRRKYRR